MSPTARFFVALIIAAVVVTAVVVSKRLGAGVGTRVAIAVGCVVVLGLIAAVLTRARTPRG